MNILPLIACLMAGFTTVLLAIPLILKVCARRPRFLRSADFHHGGKPPIPRFGGLALAAAYIGTVLITALHFSDFPHRLIIWFSPLAMFAVGFLDDLKPLGAKKKLVLQILVASAVCASGIHIEQATNPLTGHAVTLHEWGYLITIFWLVGTTNLINLVDGVDGLAGGICLMLMALLAYQCNGSAQLLAAGMAGALLGFLRYNFPPAKIYLGDGGAYFLGFQIGLLSLISSQKGTIAAGLIAPMFVLGLPIVDVTLAILRRGLRGLPVFHPDRRHLHHHLLQMGFSRRKVVLSIYAVTLVFLLMGFVAFWSNGYWTPVLAGICLLVLLICAGRLRFSREWFAVGRTVGNSLAMRRDIQSALCLTRWLTMEARREISEEGLWQNLVFVAERLGFTSVTYGNDDWIKTWDKTPADAPTFCARITLPGGRQDMIMFRAIQSVPTAAAGQTCVHFPDKKLFTIVGELMAESWMGAMRNWEQHHRRPLSFHSQPDVLTSVSKSSPRIATMNPPLMTKGELKS